MWHPIRHFRTITRHRHTVMRHCFQCGLYWQGLTHDLSKYSPQEFWVGAKYYQGNRSPNNAEREEKGYSAAWLHHKGRNKHHFEYWYDLDMATESKLPVTGLHMPKKYIAEMVCDRIAACKIYYGAQYTPDLPWLYYEKSKPHYQMWAPTDELLRKCLLMLKEEGEEKLFSYIRHDLLGKK